MLNKWEKLDKRQKLIVGAVGAFLVVWAGYAAFSDSPRKRHGGAGKGAAAATKAGKGNNKGANFEQAKKSVKAKLARAEKMTEEQYAELRKRNKNVPSTLKEFVERQRKRVAELESMGKDEWEKHKGGDKTDTVKVRNEGASAADADADELDEADAPETKGEKIKGTVEKDSDKDSDAE
ncbi:MAG: hypothetical protein EBV03_07420 [Proteobacteria bacterium]|nr:hypothetical protein [Pseudomonadota bacterium]